MGAALAICVASSSLVAAQTTAPMPGPSGAMKTNPSATPSGMAMPSANPPGPGMPPAQSGPAMNFPLTVNGKPGGTPGEVVLSQRGQDVLVTVKTPSSTPGTQQAMIYKGSCAKPSTSAAYRLTAVTNGSSQTVLKNLNVATLTGGQYALEVNATPRLCTDLNNANPLPATQQT
jgi:hypothetical protein